ncbi:hypothetical protein Fmac_010458 [Flemingia macrophylla]|uniref:UDP-rhamnose:rhamnosyltransferase 1 n=1 Tax=Flemingia macrophylla TaxID=520843 RepID=A0ABD1MJN4_9FABA
MTISEGLSYLEIVSVGPFWRVRMTISEGLSYLEIAQVLCLKHPLCLCLGLVAQTEAKIRPRRRWSDIARTCARWRSETWTSPLLFCLRHARLAAAIAVSSSRKDFFVALCFRAQGLFVALCCASLSSSPIAQVMLPWLAFGHLIPFFKLSIALAKAGVRVSFISTPKNIQRLPKLPSTLNHLLDLVQFPLPSLYKEHLPEGAEATVDIPFEKIQYLKLAYDQLQPAVKQFVVNQLPDWIICDFSPHWMKEISQEFQVKLMFFNILSAPSATFFGPGTRKTPISPESLTAPPEWVTFPSSVAFKRHEAIPFCAGANQINASGISDWERVATVLISSEAVLFRSCYEIEGEYIDAFQKLVGKPVIPIGLLPVEMPERDGGIVDECNGNIFEWLDKQASKSVVFVGFGTECNLSKDQVFEIAYGLEKSQLPFLWALRKPSWASTDQDSLPVGFHGRTSDRGIVYMGWIPQQEILAHPSIGGSLFHAGWGTTIEALQFGHSLVVLPFNIDQPLIARFLVEKGLAIEVKRNEDGSFTGNDIATSLRQAMVLEESKKLRINTREAAAIVGNLKLHQDHYIAAFVQFLKDGIWKQI